MRGRRCAQTGTSPFWNATHVLPDGGDPFFDEIQDVYEQIGEGLETDEVRPKPGQLPHSLQEIHDSGLFTDAVAPQFDWEVRYNAEAYIDLLNTFSGHIAMSPDQRTTLYTAIREHVNRRAVPEIARHWGTVLHVARRRNL